jgi:hypothetical protein
MSIMTNGWRVKSTGMRDLHTLIDKLWFLQQTVDACTSYTLAGVRTENGFVVLGDMNLRLQV